MVVCAAEFFDIFGHRLSQTFRAEAALGTPNTCGGFEEICWELECTYLSEVLASSTLNTSNSTVDSGISIQSLTKPVAYIIHNDAVS